MSYLLVTHVTHWTTATCDLMLQFSIHDFLTSCLHLNLSHHSFNEWLKMVSLSVSAPDKLIPRNYSSNMLVSIQPSQGDADAEEPGLYACSQTGDSEFINYY